MPFDTASLVSQVGSAAGTGLNFLWYIGLGVLVLIMLGVIGLIVYKKKSWNLDVEFKLTRNDARITNAEWGKGFYDAKKGVCFVKRPTKGAAKIPIKIFDIRKYLQGDRIITVIQVGPQDFRPVLNDSWSSHVETYVDDKTGEVTQVKESILNIKVDSGLNKAWKTAWDAAAKNAYSISTFMQQFQVPISIGIVVICCFVGFAILYSKIQ